MYSGVGKPTRPRGRLGFFSSCDTDGDDDDFQELNKIVVYPGKWNHWLVAKSGEASGSVKDFVEDFVVDPLDTSWIRDNVHYTIFEVPKNAETGTFNSPSTGGAPGHNMGRVAMQTHGLRFQSKSSALLNPPVMPAGGSADKLYVVSFVPPEDAPHSLPWPVDGCLEAADWFVVGATSDVWIRTGKKAGYATDLHAKAAAEEAPDPINTMKKYAVGAVVVVGGIYLAPAIARAYLSLRKATHEDDQYA